MTRLPVTALPILALTTALTGCGTTSETLDNAENEIRKTRVSYQERMDRVTKEWICTGMSWQTLARITKGNQTVMDAIVDACRDAATIPPLVSQPTDGADRVVVE